MGFFDSIGDFFSSVGGAVSSIVDTVTSSVTGFFNAVTSGDTNILEVLALGSASVFAPELLPEIEVLDEMEAASTVVDAAIEDCTQSALSDIETEYISQVQDFNEVQGGISETQQSVLNDIKDSVENTYKGITDTITDYTGSIKAQLSMVTSGNILEPILTLAEKVGVEVDVGTWMTAGEIDAYISGTLEPMFAAVKAFNTVTNGVLKDVMNLAQDNIKPVIGMIRATRGDIGAILDVYNSQLKELYTDALNLHKMVIDLQNGKYLTAVYDYIKVSDADLANQINATYQYADSSLITLRGEIHGALSDISNLARDTQRSTSLTLGTAGALVNAFGMSALADKLKDIDAIDNDFFLSITNRLKTLDDRSNTAFAFARMPFIGFIQAAIASDRSFNALAPFYSTFAVRSLSRAMTDYQKSQPKPAWMLLKNG